MVINRDDHVSAVSDLLQLAHNVRDRPDVPREASATLTAAAKDAAALCAPRVREACEALTARQ
jgi:hypothetical protein